MDDINNFEDFEELGITGDDNEDDFQQAANHVESLVSTVDNDNLLKLYGLYKQGLQGNCNTPKPSWFDFKAKSKWEAWNDLKGMSQPEAKQKYIRLVTSLDPSSSSSENSKKPSKRSWVTVSTLQNSQDSDTEPQSDQKDGLLLHAVKSGDLDSALRLLPDEQSSSDLDQLDKDGMALIHWATDRGCNPVIKLLVKQGADLHVKDGEGQTALHYASSCGHLESIELLMKLGADPNVKDNDGCNVFDVAVDESIVELLKTYQN